MTYRSKLDLPFHPIHISWYPEKKDEKKMNKLKRILCLQNWKNLSSMLLNLRLDMTYEHVYSISSLDTSLFVFILQLHSSQKVIMVTVFKEIHTFSQSKKSSNKSPPPTPTRTFQKKYCGVFMWSLLSF